jgi:steroid 5-alpha reductase family enzyme
METFIHMYGFSLLVILILMTALWLVSLYLQNASIADIFWGLGFVVIAWLTFFRTDGYIVRKLIICLLVTIWGLRLSIYIARRNFGQGEDRRYRAWRAEHGKNFWWVSFFTVFGIQGTLLWLISLTTQAGQLARVPDRITWLDLLGLLVWLVGFFFEAVGDRQLSRFRSDPQNRGRVMQAGLWRYTRHPNYFGETLIWWGLFLVTLSTPMGIWTIISPLTITFLLLKVSGVTLLEKTIVETRPEYRDYMERTSAFFPRPPKKEKSA